MTVARFDYDPDDPLAEYSFTVPGGVTEVVIFASGGGTWWGGSIDTGEPLLPWVGLRTYGVPVTPGDELTIVLGGGSSDTEPGTNGGGAGGGGERFDFPPGTELPRKWRGWGGGGATTIHRNGNLWVVAGGAGGAVEGSVDARMFVRTNPAAPPGAAEDPRSPDPYIDFGYPIVNVAWWSGVNGGVTDGAAGILQDTAGSGGGGGGFGGGASGWIQEYNYDPTWPGGAFPANGLGASAGRIGGFLVPEGVDYADPWDPSTAGPGDTGGHGFVILEYSAGVVGQGWNVGRTAL